MKVPIPRDQGYKAYYGGVGSGPAPVAWTPKAHKDGDPDEPVPRRLRGLRLRRRHRAKYAGLPLVARILIAILIALVILGIVSGMRAVVRRSELKQDLEQGAQPYLTAPDPLASARAG